MKIYAIKGREGEPGYLKQSVPRGMKLPKSWGSKPLLEVLQLFCNTYNKKNADAPISPEDHHFERPLGSTLFPDDHVDAALSDYCDVHVVPGAVKYRGPPPGTAAAAEAAEAEQRKKEEEEAARRTAEEDAKLAAEGKLKDQWRLKVRCVALDRGGMDVKSQYKAVAVTIEPHATVGMLSNRIGLMVGAHPKHQFIYHPREGAESGGPVLDPLAKLKDVTSEKVVLELVIKMPSTVKEIPVLSDDEGCLGVEDAEPPAAAADGECSDWEKQAALKAEAEELRMAGDAAGALAKLDEALALGGAFTAVSALLLCKRADLLLKAGRPKAAEIDCEAALAKNPDSAKAYKLRGKARRKLGEYETAAADFGQAQRIDFDDSILDDLKYCSTRAAKIRAIALAEEHNAKLAEAEGEKAAPEAS